MANIGDQDRARLSDGLTKLAKFGGDPRHEKAWDEARMAMAELGSVAGKLLADKPQEDVALTSSLTELDGFAESLRFSPEDDEAKRRFEISLGDVEYRLKRLFGVAVR